MKYKIKKNKIKFNDDLAETFANEMVPQIIKPTAGPIFYLELVILSHSKWQIDYDKLYLFKNSVVVAV